MGCVCGGVFQQPSWVIRQRHLVYLTGDDPTFISTQPVMGAHHLPRQASLILHLNVVPNRSHCLDLTKVPLKCWVHGVICKDQACICTTWQRHTHSPHNVSQFFTFHPNTPVMSARLHLHSALVIPGSQRNWPLTSRLLTQS